MAPVQLISFFFRLRTAISCRSQLNTLDKNSTPVSFKLLSERSKCLSFAAPPCFKKRASVWAPSDVILLELRFNCSSLYADTCIMLQMMDTLSAECSSPKWLD